MLYVVLAYDIADDRRRDRLARLLTDYLVRVQESVFEGHLGDRRHAEMLEGVADVIDQRFDNVRVYTLCQRCRCTVQALGIAVQAASPEEDAVL